MAETISLDVVGNVPEDLLHRVYKKITPDYVRELLVKNKVAYSKGALDYVVCSYEDGFPTDDLALKAIKHKKGIKFWGIASGYDHRNARVAAKYLILEYIQNALARKGFKSELNIADLNPETVAYLNSKKLFKGKLEKLEQIASKKGNMDNFVIGVHAGLSTPI